MPRHRMCSPASPAVDRRAPSRRSHRHRLLVGVVVCLWIGVTATRLVNAGPESPQQPAATAATAAQPPAPLPPGYAGADTCAICHSDYATNLERTRHGQAAHPDRRPPRTAARACHGPGQAHVDDESKGHIKRFTGVTPADVNETCLSCHNRSNHAGWEGSVHEARNLACTTCHSVHNPQSPQNQLAKATETQLCATCHRLQVAKTERAVAHMPVREGKMSCSSCHNPHGSISNVKA